MKNPGAIVKTLASMQKKMMAAQAELVKKEFSATTAGGAVKVSLNGAGEMTALHLDPDVLSEDAETVSKLVMAAYGQALEAKESAAKAVLGAAAGGLLPLGMKVPGVG